MKKILVPVDFSEYSEYALQVAAILAKQQNAEIVVLHMLGLSEAVLTKNEGQEINEAMYYMKLAENRFSAFLDKNYLEGIKVTETVQNYKIFSEVNEVAHENDADLIIMGSHGVSGLSEEVFIGSNTEKVVRTADVPVLVIKNPVEDFTMKEVVFACDFKIENIRPYHNAIKLFNSFGANVHLLYINLPGERFRSSGEIEERVRNILETGNDLGILGNLAAYPKEEEIAAFLGLEILTKKKGSPIEMAQGYIALFDKYVATAQMLDSAAYYLQRVKLPFEQRFPTDIHYFFARQDYDGLLKIVGQIPSTTVLDAWTQYRIGEAYSQKGNPIKALGYFKKAVAEKPFDLDFQEKLGSTHLQLQNLVPARQVFEFVLKENPQRPRAWTNLGYVKALQGQLDQAREHYQKALDLNPDFEQALINLAALYAHLQDKQKARQLLQRALSINPENVQAKQGLERL